jgi:regulator of protease activity HflC (stomatin/prohibitin superfamily)
MNLLLTVLVVVGLALSVRVVQQHERGGAVRLGRVVGVLIEARPGGRTPRQHTGVEASRTPTADSAAASPPLELNNCAGGCIGQP